MRLQELKSFKDLSGAAVLARILLDQDRDVLRIVETDAAGRVVALLDYPARWGIWTARESIMSDDAKARGRTTRAYDATPPDTLALAAKFLAQMDTARVGARPPARTRWREAYVEARHWLSATPATTYYRAPR